MRVFTPNLAADLARRNGAGPVWLLRFTVSGTDYVLCQDAMPIGPWSTTALPWIASWGELTEGVSSTLADFNVSSLDLNLINDANATPNLRTLAKARLLIGLPVSVYLWVDGCIDAPFEMFSFMVTDIDLPDEASVNLMLQDQSSKYENFYPGTIINRTEFPYVDPDDVGKVIPLPFGSIKKLQAIALDAGIQTTITNNIDSSMTVFEVGDSAGFSHGTLVMVDDEGMEIISISGDVVTVFRGVGGTQAINHQRGAAMWEQRTEFVYAIAAYPMASIGKVYVRVGNKDLNCTPVATKYTGLAGNEHPALPGMAVISMPGYITVSQAVSLMVNNATLNTVDGTQLVDSLGLIDYLTVSGGYTYTEAISLIDQLGLSGGITYTEAISLIDQLGLSGGITYSENIRLVDALTMASGGKDWNSGTLAYTDAGHDHTASATDTVIFTGLPMLVSQSGTPTNASKYVAAPAAGTIAATYAVAINVVGAKLITVTVPGGRWSINTQVGTVWRNIAMTVLINGSTTAAGNITVSVTSWATISGGYIEVLSAQRTEKKNAATTADAASVAKTTGTALASTGTSADLVPYVANSTGSTRIYRDPTTGLAQGGTATAFTQPANNRIIRTPAVGTGLTQGGTATAFTQPANNRITRAPAVGSGLTQGGYTPKIDQTQNNRIVRNSGTIQKANTNAKWTELSGSPAISGNSVANTLIGDAILVDVVSPITAPQDVITKILGPACNLIGTFPAGYSFNGAITTSRRAPEWCHELARQCRSYFKWILGQPTLIVRPGVLTPVKSINEIRLSNGMMSHGQKLTDINDVINTINLRYDRDYSSTSSGDEVYQHVSAGTHAASITTYGVRERPDLFKFDFVTNPTMAASLTAFYLAWYPYQRWQHTQECYLFEAALEFADAVTLAYLGGVTGECAEVGFNPGNGMNIDKIQLTVIE